MDEWLGKGKSIPGRSMTEVDGVWCPQTCNEAWSNMYSHTIRVFELILPARDHTCVLTKDHHHLISLFSTGPCDCHDSWSLRFFRKPTLEAID